MSSWKSEHCYNFKQDCIFFYFWLSSLFTTATVSSAAYFTFPKLSYRKKYCYDISTDSAGIVLAPVDTHVTMLTFQEIPAAQQQIFTLSVYSSL